MCHKQHTKKKMETCLPNLYLKFEISFNKQAVIVYSAFSVFNKTFANTAYMSWYEPFSYCMWSVCRACAPDEAHCLRLCQASCQAGGGGRGFWARAAAAPAPAAAGVAAPSLATITSHHLTFWNWQHYLNCVSSVSNYIDRCPLIIKIKLVFLMRSEILNLNSISDTH